MIIRDFFAPRPQLWDHDLRFKQDTASVKCFQGYFYEFFNTFSSLFLSVINLRSAHINQKFPIKRTITNKLTSKRIASLFDQSAWLSYTWSYDSFKWKVGNCTMTRSISY